MLWKVAARTYLDKRREFSTMDAATFTAYHAKWKPKALRALLDDADSNLHARWEGFNDALVDEVREREALERGDTFNQEFQELGHLLDYLYQEDGDGEDG